ncbi:flavin reductase family protein [Streptacidiphilus albus]|uniref:flavin reductase family protein n=1 Tax=Streptacidiphilus albus TaxID=105425 RepID=UPI000AE52606|nr:flavin reductase family protein [Streptacidiphilus albus]
MDADVDVRPEDRTGSGPGLAEAFREAMAQLVSGVVVVCARQADGAPCGLLVSSVCSYSVQPPSVLLAVARTARTYRALAAGAGFGVHLLGSEHAALAAVFAGRGDDKFAGVGWDWDGEVPRLLGVPGYLRCATRASFQHGDHAILVGEVEHCSLGSGEPLLYFRRRLDWRLSAATARDGG